MANQRFRLEIGQIRRGPAGVSVREYAGMRGIASLAADLVPDLGEQVASGFSLALMMMQLRAFVDAGERFIGDHQLLLSRLMSRRWMDRRQVPIFTLAGGLAWHKR